jgi:hypothetical protein
MKSKKAAKIGGKHIDSSIENSACYSLLTYTRLIFYEDTSETLAHLYRNA